MDLKVYEIDAQTRSELVEMSRAAQELHQRIEWGIKMYRQIIHVPSDYVLNSDGSAFVPPHQASSDHE